MVWFHTFALPVVTAAALFLGFKNSSPAWKHAALVLGCALMLAGLWLDADLASTALLLAGGAAFFLGRPQLRQGRSA